jgi:hypothetical protein
MDIARRAYAIELYTMVYKVEGVFQPLGDLLEDINSPERACFYMSDLTFTPLDPGSRLPPLSVPEAGFSKRDVLLVCFKDENVVDELHLLRRVERLIVYTPAFALRGNMHLGVEQHIRDMLDTMRGRFQPMTEVTLFPLIDTQVDIPRAQSILLLNTDLVQVYYPEITGSQGTA